MLDDSVGPRDARRPPQASCEQPSQSEVTRETVAGAAGFAGLLVSEKPRDQDMIKEINMCMRKRLGCSTGGGAGLAAIALLFITIVDPSPANAGMTDSTSKSASVITASSGPTDVSSRRRRSSNRGGSAAGLAFMGMAIGTMGAIAAQQQRNDYYNRYDNGPGYYGGGPRYYGGGPYGGGPYYGRRYYRSY